MIYPRKTPKQAKLDFETKKQETLNLFSATCPRDETPFDPFQRWDFLQISIVFRKSGDSISTVEDYLLLI